MTQPPYDQSGSDFPQMPPASGTYPPQTPAYPPQEPQNPFGQAPTMPQPQYAQPGQPPMGAPEPPKKKGKAGKVVLIVVIVVAIVAAVGYFGFKAFFGNRLTPYCQTYVKIGTQVEDLNNQMVSASANADMDEMSDIMGQMITLFDELRDSSPPDTVAPSMDTVIDYLTHIKQFVDTQDFTGYEDYMNQHDPMEFANAADTVDSASLEYCNNGKG